MNTPDWISQAFKTIDAQDSKAFAALFDEAGEFRFGNAPGVVGPAAVEQAVAGFFGSIGGLSHRLIQTWEGKDSWVVEGEVTYTRKNGSKLTVPFCDIFRMRGTKVKAWLIFMDIGQLYTQ
jgi:ketosteroid isomerase-like protein